MVMPRSGFSGGIFARLFALGGSAALFSDPAWARQAPAASPLPPDGAAAGEAFWKSVRDQFVMPPDLAVMNAANLCPASRPALEALDTRDEEHRPGSSPDNRARLDAREGEHAQGARRVPARDARRDHHHAQHQRVEQPGLDRPRSQGRRRSDRPLGQPSEQPRAWREKAQALRIHGDDRRRRTRIPGQTTTSTRSRGDDAADEGAVLHAPLEHGRRSVAGEGVVPARARARRPDAVDGAQSFGLLDVDLADMQPDFYWGSAHKWPCGASECGVLFVNKAAQPRLWPSIYSAYPGARRVLAHVRGLRPARRGDDDRVRRGAGVPDEGRARGHRAARTRAHHAARRGAGEAAGRQVWTSPDAELRAAVVSFLPAARCRQAATALYEKDKIAVATRGGQDRGGHARLAAPLQQSGRDRSAACGLGILEDRRVIGD